MTDPAHLSALYYPHTTVRDEALLRDALLLWDRVGFIVPWKDFPTGQPNSRLVSAAVELVGRAIEDLRDHPQGARGQTADYGQELRHLAQSEERSRRLRTISGVGPTTASAVVASIGSGHEFENGRQFAAWLGLVER